MAKVVMEPSETCVEIATTAVAPAGPGCHMHKNRLQEFTQKSGLRLPSYSTFNEGEPHAPKFRATILVDGMTLISPHTFCHRKEAEQEVAKLALEIISVKLKNEGSRNIRKDPVFCKMILNEYVAKLKKEVPTYSTTQQEGLLPIFITTVTFDGKTYVGFAGRSKKEAEKNAAVVVIDSILANSNTFTIMSQIIKTKGKLYATMNDDANAGNATSKSEVQSDVAANVIERTEPNTVATNASILPPECLPPGMTSWIPYTSPWSDTANSNQLNYQISSSGLPFGVVDSQAISTRNRKKNLKKRKANRSKRRRVDEQPSTTCTRTEGES